MSQKFCNIRVDSSLQHISHIIPVVIPVEVMEEILEIRTIGCLNIHGAHVTANNSTNNNVVFFFVSDLKIVYSNNYKSSIIMPWIREEKLFCNTTDLEIKSLKTV